MLKDNISIVNRKRFIELVSSEQESLRRFLLALCCGNRPDAEDIAQEALVKSYLAAENYDEQQKFTAWLYRIAYNTFLDSRKKSRKLSQLNEAVNAVAPNAADDSYKYQELYAALNKLPEKERTAILLFHLKGYSIKEIAQIVENSEDAVKKQLSRGREHLKQIIR